MWPFSRRVSKAELQDQTQRAFAAGQAAEREESWRRREEFRLQELQHMIGRPLIIVPNEWDNPVIGFGKEIAYAGRTPMLVVSNYVSGEDSICGGVMMDFSEQRLEICLQLDPYQLWAITAHNAVGNENFEKPKSGDRWERPQIVKALKERGFFARWEAFKVGLGN